MRSTVIGTITNDEKKILCKRGWLLEGHLTKNPNHNSKVWLTHCSHRYPPDTLRKWLYWRWNKRVLVKHVSHCQCTSIMTFLASTNFSTWSTGTRIVGTEDSWCSHSMSANTSWEKSCSIFSSCSRPKGCIRSHETVCWVSALQYHRRHAERYLRAFRKNWSHPADHGLWNWEI